LHQRASGSGVQVRTNPGSTPPQLAQLKDKAMAAFGVPAHHVFVWIPYVSERERSYAIDRLTYKVGGSECKL
jgi:hypothetical protein